MSDSEFDAQFVEKSLADTYLHIANSMERRLQENGKLIDNPAHSFEELLSDIALFKIVSFTNPQLHKAGHAPTKYEEAWISCPVHLW